MAEKMKALVKEGRRLAVQKIAPPALEADGQVIVQVIMAGLCRTDLYAASGILKTPDSLVLGHEFAGVISESSSNNFKAGDRVVVNPLLSCGHCRHCLNQTHGACGLAEFIGIDRQGCFAGYINVPAASIYRIPETLPFQSGAYAEPVAAALAVLKTGIKPEQKGLMIGANRFSQLLQKIMRVYGFANIDRFDPIKEGATANLEESSYDYVIETLIDSKILATMVRVVKPGGIIILKSRQHEEISFKLADLIKKEPILHVVNYGSFDEAIDLLSSGRIEIDDLIDGVYPLEQFRKVFSGAQGNEALKPFFAPWD
ncbi:MAG: alcohol dehydrogenase catalytic domain-containing protein [Cyanobacteria bacterium REEB67]|nr:alcohol dehydrogenase catalytic domain-containing protein [Cyanobacteria bacterium REEB67]